jgi:hypothetical protein
MSTNPFKPRHNTTQHQPLNPRHGQGSSDLRCSILRGYGAVTDSMQGWMLGAFTFTLIPTSSQHATFTRRVTPAGWILCRRGPTR